VSKKPIKLGHIFRPDPTRRHPPIDKDLKLPHQVRRAAALADALITGHPSPKISATKRSRGAPKVPLDDSEIDEAVKHLDRGNIRISDPVFSTIIELAREGAKIIKAHRDGARKPRRGGCTKVPKRSRSSPKIQLSDSEIDEALKCLDRGAIKASDPIFATILTLAGEGAKIIKARRKGARKPRRKSDGIVPRVEAELQAFREISPKRQRFPHGKMTVKELSKSLKKQGLGVSEETIRQHLKQIRPLVRLVQKGIVPPPGPKSIDRKLSKKTQREMVAGKRALAKHRSRRFLGNS
jgi:hypothetical protein